MWGSPEVSANGTVQQLIPWALRGAGLEAFVDWPCLNAVRSQQIGIWGVCRSTEHLRLLLLFKAIPSFHKAYWCPAGRESFFWGPALAVSEGAIFLQKCLGRWEVSKQHHCVCLEMQAFPEENWIMTK